MDYMTLKEAAEKWGVTPRRVNYYCAGGRIPGAVIRFFNFTFILLACIKNFN